MTDPAPAPLAYFDPGDGRRIAYRLRPPSEEGAPVMLFLPGYASDMEGTKALALDEAAARSGLGMLRMDYSGTGSSGGDFADGTLQRWLDEVVAAIDLVAPEGSPLLLVGSSMGGWLMFHAAMRRPDRVRALLGIAAAPDFTDWGFTADDKARLVADGRLDRPNPYGPEPSVTHRGFWESGAALRLLYKPVDVVVPVRLVHGEQDSEVPIGVPIKLMADCRSSDVQLTLIKNGGHRLSEPHEIHAILREAGTLVEQML